jgi:hypothetical protein
MVARLALSVLICLLLAVPGPAADPLIPPRHGEGRVELRFADGSAVRMLLTDAPLEVTTKFGRMRVPVDQIKEIAFATRIPGDIAARIDAAAIRLASDDPKEREAAVAELYSHQELAYPTLEKLTKSPDIEVKKQAERMVAALREKLPEERLRYKTHDTVVADAFTIVGRIENITLKGKSIYFGEQTLRISDLRGMRRAPDDGTEKVVFLDAVRHGAPVPNWFNTGVEVTRETVLDIRADGEVDLYPIGAELGMYRAGPAGNAQWGVARDQKMPGKLFGRIGEKGIEFEIGTGYQGPAKGEGKLFLRIGGSPWHVVPAGQYRVQITIR